MMIPQTIWFSRILGLGLLDQFLVYHFWHNFRPPEVWYDLSPKNISQQTLVKALQELLLMDKMHARVDR